MIIWLNYKDRGDNWATKTMKKFEACSENDWTGPELSLPDDDWQGCDHKVVRLAAQSRGCVEYTLWPGVGKCNTSCRVVCVWQRRVGGPQKLLNFAPSAPRSEGKRKWLQCSVRVWMRSSAYLSGFQISTLFFANFAWRSWSGGKIAREYGAMPLHSSRIFAAAFCRHVTLGTLCRTMETMMHSA